MKNISKNALQAVLGLAFVLVMQASYAAYPESVDTDQDGLLNFQEIDIGTDPEEADTDNDGIIDGDEVVATGTVTIVVKNGDGDYISDPLDSNIVDSDLDGVVDQDDLKNYDPCVPSDTVDACTQSNTVGIYSDADQDGVRDVLEVSTSTIVETLTVVVGTQTITVVVMGTGTNPANNDTDSDGLNDGLELTLGLSPILGDSDGDCTQANICSDNDSKEYLPLGSAVQNDGEYTFFNGVYDYTVRDGLLNALESSSNDSDGDFIPDEEDSANGNPCIGADFDDGGDNFAGGGQGKQPAICTGQSDTDTLTDFEEINVTGTEHDNYDTDGDMTPDDQEIGSDIYAPLNLGTTTAAIDALDPCYPSTTALACSGDTDGDMVPDGSETTAGTDPTNPDTDGDGYTDGEEFGTGTVSLNIGTMTVTVNGVETNPIDPLDACYPNINADTCDQDQDGLPNASETIAGTSPTVADTDGDMVLDGEEFGTGTVSLNIGTMTVTVNGVETDPIDPLDACYPDVNADTCDQDLDGLPNASETIAGTSPTVADTDGDGLNDGEEVTGVDNTSTTAVQPTGTTSSPTDICDPFTTDGSCDPDGDNLTNDEELQAGTSPTVADTDGDGTNDGVEVGADPANPENSDTSTTAIDALDPCFPSKTATTCLNPDPCVPDVNADDCDQDGDNLTNEEEEEAGTSPTVADTDGDGLNDGEEVNGVDSTSTTAKQPAGVESDPLDACDPNPNADACESPAASDCFLLLFGSDCSDIDGDGLSDVFEIFISGTNIFSQDTDGDGLKDGEEVNGVDDTFTPLVATGPSDPKNPCDPFQTVDSCQDSDGDGLTNGEETTGVDNPATTLVPPRKSEEDNACDPFPAAGTCDQDGDDLTNAQEASAQTNPLLADTDCDGTNDGDEVNAGSDPLDPASPNATNGCSVGLSVYSAGSGSTPLNLLILSMAAMLLRRRKLAVQAK